MLAGFVQNAASEVVRRHGPQAEVCLPTGVADLGAAWGEGAAGGQVGQIRHITGDGGNRLPFRGDAWQTVQQPLGIGMLRGFNHLIDRAAFDDAAGVHHGDAVAKLGGQPQIMGNQDDAGVMFLVDAPHQVNDLGLNGHVEGRCRLIRQEDGRFTDQPNSDERTLLHATGELVRVSPVACLGGRNADFGHHLQDALFLGPAARTIERPRQRRAAVNEAMQSHRFPNLLTDREDRVQGAERVLKDHRNGLPPDSAHGPLGQAAQILPTKQNLSGGDAARPGDQAQN